VGGVIHHHQTMTQKTLFPPLKTKTSSAIKRDGLKIGLGGAPLGNLFHAVSDADANAIIQQAISDGCQTFDTAPHYGHGLSEQRFGQALRGIERSSFVLSSKVGRILTPSAMAARDQLNFYNILPYNQHWDYSAAGVRRSVEDSLQRMGMSHLDVAFVHDCCSICHGDNYPNILRQVMEEAMPELQKMKREGLIHAIGLGVNEVQVCLDFLKEAELDCILLAGRYTLVDHTGLAQLLPICEQRGIRVAIGGVFNSGILATGVKNFVGKNDKLLFNYDSAPALWVERVAAIEAVCDDFNVPLRAAALQFPLAHPSVDTVLLGAQQMAHWLDALAMMQFDIPAAFWAKLKADGLIPAHAHLPVSQSQSQSVLA
jgi:D-threo-aldose 1-dehydrogenase